MATILRLLHFLPATISRAATAASNTRNSESMAAAGPQPIHAEMLTAIRPATQVEKSRTSGLPCNGNLPVQFGTAVSRKPATTAAMYPNSISWTCQSRGTNAVLSCSFP